MEKDSTRQVESLRQFSPADHERRIAREAPLWTDLAPIRAPSSHVCFSLWLLDGPLDVGKARAAFLAGQCRSLFEVSLKACQVRPMGRRHVFQVEEMHLVGRRVHLAGEKMRIGRNLNPV